MVIEPDNECQNEDTDLLQPGHWCKVCNSVQLSQEYILQLTACSHLMFIEKIVSLSVEFPCWDLVIFHW